VHRERLGGMPKEEELVFQRSTFITLAITILFLAAVPLAAIQPSPVLGAMQEELSRSMEQLQDQPQPPYFISYEVIDTQQVMVTASFGALTSSENDRMRTLDIDLRVGDYALDSSHPIRGDRYGGMFDRYSYVKMPIEDETEALRSVLWYHTDRQFKKALEKFTKVKTNVTVKDLPLHNGKGKIQV
jgi:TldD protein